MNARAVDPAAAGGPALSAALATGPITVERVEGKAAMKEFLTFVGRIFANDPNWVAPLLFERFDHLNPIRNPFFANAEVAYWIARRDGRPVGRISAQVNRAHLERHRDATGQFGFLDAIDDAAVFGALIETAETWLRARDIKRVTGPFTLSINDESGLLVDGFDSPPYMMMGHAFPYYAERLEECGYHKAVDLLAYLYDFQAEIPPRVQKLLDNPAKRSSLSFRPMNMKRFDEEIATIVEIFNDAWQDNWGFVPFNDAELAYLGKSLRPIVSADFVAIGEVNGKPASMAVTLPNLNEAIRDLGGRLLPFGWARLLWRLKVRGTDTVRLPLMGVKREYHNTATGGALAYGVIERIRKHHTAIGTRHAELSWILESNGPMRAMIELLGTHVHKRYRVYEKALA
ncbi:hypothetical protein [Oceanibacterium hippocampi]|uniref:N-acetyltransferase domain-containing protein n=1 Tax=Oceanibacterium hippocampi TaxID=745714 RepID=A0A1Y5U3V7_9PROT|nr:hypothetical protein [Oceanibacterium hippocampi]SLN76218.1 hypothetical protein OCH7691_04067 [Oceanibacterium hippocampi]